MLPPPLVPAKVNEGMEPTKGPGEAKLQPRPNDREGAAGDGRKDSSDVPEGVGWEASLAIAAMADGGAAFCISAAKDATNAAGPSPAEAMTAGSAVAVAGVGVARGTLVPVERCCGRANGTEGTA